MSTKIKCEDDLDDKVNLKLVGHRVEESSEDSDVKVKQEDGPSDLLSLTTLFHSESNDVMEKKKRQFEEFRDLILADIPQKVKELFGTIVFTKVGKQTLPCLAMNPFSVPPGNAREMWLEMYHKVRNRHIVTCVSLVSPTFCDPPQSCRSRPTIVYRS